ncbi:hypothetical protein Tco_1472163 [Tanacetum coccineum]
MDNNEVKSNCYDTDSRWWWHDVSWCILGGNDMIGCGLSDGCLAVDSARRLATRCFTMNSSLSKLSANFTMDSSMVGGVDGLDVGGI